MNYTANLYSPLENLYDEKGLFGKFSDDNSYLKSAFVESTILWEQNFTQLTKIKYIVIGEAPLWGDMKNYIYNPDRHNTQFFTRKDLGSVLGTQISNKVEFIQHCRQIGLVFIDTFPFALNKKTMVSYQKLAGHEYRNLFKQTAANFFIKKIIQIHLMCTMHTKVAFRYTRTKNNLNSLIEDYLAQNKIATSCGQIISLSKQGGQIDRSKLTKFLIE